MRNIYLLNNDFYEGVITLPVIKIVFFDIDIDLSLYDALIFTSKNGVRAIDRLNNLWKEKAIYSIGRGTSKEIEKFGAKPSYTAKTSYGNSFADEIKLKLEGKKVLFLRAKTVTSKLNEILRANGVLLDEVVVYETVCAKYTKKSTPKENAVIIFSSPSTIECFFKNFDWKDSYRAVCIGEVTSSYLPLHVKPYMAEKQTISSCIDRAKTLLQ